MTKRHAELCRVTTHDGLLLDGALRVPEQATDRLPVDACLLVHGTGSNFTTPGVLETLAQQAVDAGLTSLRVNTRGHDLMARIPRPDGAILGGASYENIADCRHDLSAWADFPALEFLSIRSKSTMPILATSAPYDAVTIKQMKKNITPSILKPRIETSFIPLIFLWPLLN